MFRIELQNGEIVFFIKALMHISDKKNTSQPYEVI